MKKLREMVTKAIDVYNRYRAPEAVARLIEIRNDVAIIEFRGHFCYTCGVTDWIEDMKYVMEDLGLEAEILDIVRTGLDSMKAFFSVRPRDRAGGRQSYPDSQGLAM